MEAVLCYWEWVFAIESGFLQTGAGLCRSGFLGAVFGDGAGFGNRSGFLRVGAGF